MIFFTRNVNFCTHISNIICIFAPKSQTRHKTMHTKTLIISSIIMLTMLSCKHHKDSNIINTADDLLWENPDSCIAYIQAIEKPTSKYTQERLSLIKNHAYYKVTGTIENDSLLSEQIEYFTQEGEYRDAGEANYIIGASYVQQGKFFEATSYLKTAEKMFQKTDFVNPGLIGLLYFNLGIASEKCRLFDVALGYCKMAIPHLKNNGNPIYTSVCYHLIGKCHSDKDSCLLYLDSAIAYTKEIENLVFRNEIEITRYKLLHPNEVDSIIIDRLLYLCDTCQVGLYASEIAFYYMKIGNQTKALEYLNKLSTDTAINIWSREHYYVLQSELLYAQGEYKQAYHIIQNLHKRQTNDIGNF